MAFVCANRKRIPKKKKKGKLRIVKIRLSFNSRVNLIKTTFVSKKTKLVVNFMQLHDLNLNILLLMIEATHHHGI
jgi:hypothetical protein